MCKICCTDEKCAKMNNRDIQDALIQVCKEAAKEYNKCSKCSENSKIINEKRIKFELFYSLIEKFNLVEKYENYSLSKKPVKRKWFNRQCYCKIIINLKR